MEGDVPVIKDLATREEEQKERIVADIIKAVSKPKSEKEGIEKPPDNWRTDLHKTSSLRWYGKLPENPDETLTLRYKTPEWPHQKPLWYTLTQVPKLTCLVLDRSEIDCLRELGSSLQSLVTLSICNCGLTSLDGTFAFPNLRTLIAADNKLTYAAQCSFLEELQHLDLCGNPINDFESFVHLSLCTNLRSLHLNGTPISKYPDFQTKVKHYIPQLKELYPGGYREDPDEQTADLDAFLHRNKLLIGSSYDEMGKSKGSAEKKKKKDKVVEPVPLVANYQDVPPEGSEKSVHIKHFASHVSERSQSATSVWSAASSNDLPPISPRNSTRTAEEKD